MSKYQTQEPTAKNWIDLKVLNAERGLEKREIFESMEGAAALTGSYKKMKIEETFDVTAYTVSELADKLVGYEVNGEKWLFSQDPYKPLRIISETDFLNRMRDLTESELTEMMIVELFMGQPIEKSLYGVPVSADLFKYEVSNCSTGSNIGYTDKALLTYPRGTAEGMFTHVEFQFIGQKRVYSFLDTEPMYREFVVAVQKKAGNGSSLTTLSTWELIAWYKLKKYDVMFNVVTGEWTITKAYTTKVMYVEREELNNFEKVVSDFNSFIVLKEANPRFNTYHHKFSKDYYKFAKKYNEPVELKRYDLSLSSTVKLGVYNRGVELPYTYQVSSDDGRYVVMVPYEENEEAPVITMPRKDVGYVYQRDDDGTSMSFVVPYAIPVDVENSVKGLEKEIEGFKLSTSEFELKQSLALDHFLENMPLIQALAERDYELAKTFIDKNASPRKNVMGYSYDGLSKKGKARYTAFRSMDVIIEMSTEALFDIFFDMYSSVRNLPAEELTLYELELKYKMEYNETLETTGIRGFYIIGLENVHTTKYNLLDVEGTMAKLGYLKSSEKEIYNGWIY